MSYLFFVSYAREDGRASERLYKLHEDLSTEVRKRGGLPQEDVSFLEVEEVKTGEDWAERVRFALKTAKLLVCLMSPTYLTREFCGKEFQVFRERDQRYRETLLNPLSRPPIILPLLWVPPKAPLPVAVAAYQQHDNDLPREYREEGVEYLIRLNTKQDIYQEFLVRFADKILEAVASSSLPVLDDLRHFDQIDNPFKQLQSVAGGTGSHVAPEPGGPSSARFIFAAPRQREMLGVRSSLTAYDDKGGWYWRPFWPAQDSTIGEFAQEIASQARMRYHELSLDQDLEHRIREARQDNSILIVVLDPWAVRLEYYRLSLAPFDELSSLHSAVVIVWDASDQETLTRRPLLDDALRVTFPSKLSSKPALQIRNDITSSDELRQSLRDTLVGIQMRILEVGEAKRRMEGAFVPKPAIPVPGGAET